MKKELKLGQVQSVITLFLVSMFIPLFLTKR